MTSFWYVLKGYGVFRVLNSNSGSFMAIFSTASYINYGKSLLDDSSVIFANVINL